MNDRTRRQFLLQTGLALGGIAAGTPLLNPESNAESVSAADQLAATPKPRPRLRGLMLDAARVPEPLEYYRRVIDFSAEWKFNALHFRLADDQGSALRFSSAPALLFHKHAFTPEQLHDLALYAGRSGVDLIPELESFGHTGYITRSPAYAHLLDADPRLPSEFTGVIPVHPETADLFKKLYREISSIFPSSFLHGGCDEVNWGGSSLSRKALQTRQRNEIWADYLNSLGQIADSLQKQFIVWGDIVLHKEPKILDRLSKKIIVMDWNYTETSSVKIKQALSTMQSRGFRGIGAPALINYQWGPRAGSDQLANIDAFSDAYLENDDPASLGVILTNWVPSRYIQNSIWDGFAYAAAAFNAGSTAAQKSGFRNFVERHYGADWNGNWAEMFRLVYDNAPRVGHRENNPMPLHVPWSSDEQLAAALTERLSRSIPFTRLHNLVQQLEDKVTKNLADFQAFALSVSYLQHVYWRESIVLESFGNPLTLEGATLLIKDIAQRDRVVEQALSKDWDQGRFSDSAAKSQPLFGFQPKDQLVFHFHRAADYSASLASHPERLFQLLRTSRSA